MKHSVIGMAIAKRVIQLHSVTRKRERSCVQAEP